MLAEGDFQPTEAAYFCERQVENYRKAVITFFRTAKPYRYLKLSNILYGEIKTFDPDEIITANIREETNPLSAELAINTLGFRLHSNDARFNIMQPTGVYKLLQQLQPLKVWLNEGNAQRQMGLYYFGDGRDYEIGVWLVGAGGSGAAYSTNSYGSGTKYAIATGGASGYPFAILKRVTPGDVIPIVIGAGGASVSTPGLGRSESLAGIDGGSTAFDAGVVPGGKGGTTRGAQNLTFVVGGQYASPIINTDSHVAEAPSMGTGMSSAGFGEDTLAARHTQFNDIKNPFNFLRMLGAGGYAGSRMTNATIFYQTGATLDDGLKSGGGKVTLVTGTTGEPATAEPGTSPGSGGGAAVCTSTNSGTTWSGVATSGRGADGAALIYVRRIA